MERFKPWWEKLEPAVKTVVVAITLENKSLRETERMLGVRQGRGKALELLRKGLQAFIEEGGGFT